MEVGLRFNMFSIGNVGQILGFYITKLFRPLPKSKLGVSFKMFYLLGLVLSVEARYRMFTVL